MKVVAIGGGGGAQQVLRGMLAYSGDLTALIAVTDTGRSTGVARELVGMPAPGDLRSTISGLAFGRDTEIARLLEYRLRTSSLPQLDGMAVGNLLLAALTQQTGDFAHAVATLQRLAGCAARVLPVSTVSAQLCAMLEDGSRVEGELAVRGLGKAPIMRVVLDQPAPAYGPALEAIAEADLVVLGPGSLFTTLLATLAFEGMVAALQATAGAVVYICNTTTQPGQTDGYTPLRHVEQLLARLGPGTLDAVLIDASRPAAEVLARYAAQGVEYMVLDEPQFQAIQALVPLVVLQPLAEDGGHARQLWNKVDTIRHHPAKVAAALHDIMTSRMK